MNEIKKDKTKKIIVIVLIVLIAVLVVDIVLRFVPFKNMFSNGLKTVTSKEVTITDNGISEAVDKLYDATVIVEIKSDSSVTAWGSGFVYKTDDKYGYIFTNHHVIENASQVVVVNTKGGETNAEVVGSDEYADVAVLRIPVSDVLAVANIGKSTDAKLGDTIFAIGTPVSLQYKFSVSRGIISGKDRMVQMNSSSNIGYFQQVTDSWYMNLLQIDASINAGNSGGPLANVNGEVIGINSSKLSQSSSKTSIENIGFAIPIEDALVVADSILKDGKVYRPVLGVSLSDITSITRNQYNLSDNISYGALLTSVSSGSLAESAGLKSGDVVIKIEDYTITNYKYFKYYIYRYKKGDKVKLTYIRGSNENTASITLN